MKDWLRKVTKNTDFQNQNAQKSQSKHKKVIVSFDKHVQKTVKPPSYQATKNHFIVPNSEYQRNYSPRRHSNLSNCVEYDGSQFEFSPNNQKPKIPLNKSYNTKKQSQNSKDQKGQFSKPSEEKQNESQDESQGEVNSSDEQNYVLNPSQQISQQIVNSLISMQDLIKMIKPIPQIKGEYITLRRINKFLTIDEITNKADLSNYILNKSSEGVNAYINNEYNGKKSYRKIVKKLIKRKSDSKNETEETTRSDSINKFFFRTFSNGLIYQYYPVRALIWKIASGYLPQSKEKWIWKMEVSLLKYRELVKQYICEPILKKKKSNTKINTQKQTQKKENTKENEQSPQLRKKQQTFTDPLSRMNAQKKQQKDHPLNLKQDSKWKSYFEDFQLWSLIEKDTVRTRQTIQFFKQANTFSLTNEEPKQSDIVSIQLQNSEKVQFRLNELHLSKTKKQQTTYIDALTRIIFIYLKVHSEQKYYQGINQIVAIIYYSFTNKNNEYFRRVSESDTYEVLMLLMAQLNTHPLKSAQNVKMPVFNHFSSGQKYFDLLKTMIQKYDFRLHDFLNKNKGFDYLKAISIRWFLTIFLSEFSLDEALILWDCVMILIEAKPTSSGEKRHTLKGVKLTEFILYMSLAVVHLNRNEIYSEESSEIRDCSNILIIFQKINQKPEQIIEKAMTLYKSFPNLLE